MPPPSAALTQGHYARKQLFSRSRLVAWSHTRRFELARHLVAPFAGRRLLDYGSGDGTFLALVHDLFPTALGVDVEPGQVRECALRLAALDGLTFATTDAIADARHAGRYEVVTCMEVLEHCPDDIRERVLDDLRRVSAPGAAVIISVPIETGPSLAAKQAVRAFAAAAGLREYAGRERYSPRELLAMTFARPHTSIARQENTTSLSDGRVIRFTGHKGFNWRALEQSVAARFTIERRLFSPMPALRGWLNSQAWFVCRASPAERRR
jgi:2-polyprenyl-3-methyl-5-hydroxy-6-metoxy-1,4-benzoquinol methylase